MTKTIHIYIDGACKGNPGPGGWGVLIQQPGQPDLEFHGGEERTTNNKMELQAAIQAMTQVTPLLDEGTTAMIYTDSKYVQKGLTEWLQNWKRNGWKTSAGKPVQNTDLWQRLDELVARANGSKVERVLWRWVKGHSGHPGNERADTLANLGVAGVIGGNGAIWSDNHIGSTSAVSCSAGDVVTDSVGGSVQVPLRPPRMISITDHLRLLAESPDFRDMTISRLLLLLTIASNPGIEQKDLGQLMGMSQSTLSRNCNALGGRGYKHNGGKVGGNGWITLVRSSADYRRQLVYMTEEGKRVVAGLLQKMIAT